MKHTALIVPAFLILLGLEYILIRKRKRLVMTIESTITNISVGIAERLLNLLVTGSFYGLYVIIHENFAIWKIPNYWATWGLLLLATDLIWYWYHRLGHEINIMWGAHIVHHQSEEFNYSVSARITTLQAVIRNLFWCILPLAGFQPTMVISILVVHGAYSFFTHTEVIGKLGWLEKILITPSHHRVHHASNEKYLNKNYGDIFVFWDKIFGTFQAEEEKPVYGLTHPLKSHSFLWQHFHYYAELWEACRRSGSVTKSLQILIGKPEALDQEIRTYIEDQLLPRRRKPQITLRFKAYLILQIVISLITLFVITILYESMSMWEVCFSFALVLLTLINCGALLEQQRWIYALEVLRLFILAAWLGYETESIELLVLTSILLLVISTLDTVQRRYFHAVYNIRI